MGTEEQGLQNIVKTCLSDSFFPNLPNLFLPKSTKLLIVFIIKFSVITKVDADIRYDIR